MRRTGACTLIIDTNIGDWVHCEIVNWAVVHGIHREGGNVEETPAFLLSFPGMPSAEDGVWKGCGYRRWASFNKRGKCIVDAYHAVSVAERLLPDIIEALKARP